MSKVKQKELKDGSKAYTKLIYKIGNKEYDGAQKIHTTMFLEIWRITSVSAKILYAYKSNKKFRDSIDELISDNPFGYMLLGAALESAACECLTCSFEDHEIVNEDNS